MPELPVLHIVDSEIRGQGGHNLSFARSICDGTRNIQVHVWADRDTTLEHPDPNVTIHHYFHRRFRKLQTLFLVARLLRQNAKLLFSTASSADLFTLRLIQRFRHIRPQQVFLFFHFINRMNNKGKQRFYEKAAQTVPDVHILAPADSVSTYFTARGFANVSTTPYPVNGSNEPANIDYNYDHLLVSGHLRIDKGAAALAEFVEFLAERNDDIVIYLQGDEDLSRYTESELAYWNRITRSAYPNLRVFPCALSPHDYRSLFRGAISLQLYDPVIFHDRASGAALDALINGTPIVALQGSWNAKLVQQYGAGLLVGNTKPEEVYDAVSKIISDYGPYRERSLLAGRAIRETHSSKAILNRIFGA